MRALLDYLDGKKTYCACAVIGALLFGSWQGWWKIPPEVYTGLMAVAIAFLRLGVSKVNPPL